MKNTPKQGSQCYVWDFTIPYTQAKLGSTIDENISHELIVTFLNQHCKSWSFQFEKGDVTDYLHYQGRLSLKTKKREHEVVALFAGDFGYYARLSRTSKNAMNSVEYVTKDFTRIAGPWKHDDKPLSRNVRDIGTDKEPFFPWEESLIRMVSEYHDRCIDLVIQPGGNAGKSTFVKFLCETGKAVELVMIRSLQDLMRQAFNCETSKVYIVDLPRAEGQKGEKLRDLYAGLEKLKIGMAYDDRYAYKIKYFDPPRIVVFCNTLPDLGLLTEDRWRLWTINEKKELVEYKSITQAKQEQFLSLNIIRDPFLHPSTFGYSKRLELPVGIVPSLPTPRIRGDY